jgi:Flp pilus assembly protein TadD
VKRWSGPLALDVAYPLPHVNFARLALVEGDREEAERHLATAKGLGYSGTMLDQLLHEAQSLLAHIEGRAAPRGD